MQFGVERLAIADVLLLRPRQLRDSRGYFMETYRASVLKEHGVDADFVQENQSLSVQRGTIRGLHFQRAPAAQAKLVRIVSGAVFDVAVDLRRESASYGKWVGATLTADGNETLFIPRGFAHGFCTIEPDTAVIYKCDGYYAAAHEGGVHYADPDLGITWPVDAGAAIVSDKDAVLPRLGQVEPLTGE